MVLELQLIAVLAQRSLDASVEATLGLRHPSIENDDDKAIPKCSGPVPKLIGSAMYS